MKKNTENNPNMELVFLDVIDSRKVCKETGRERRKPPML